MQVLEGAPPAQCPVYRPLTPLYGIFTWFLSTQQDCVAQAKTISKNTRNVLFILTALSAVGLPLAGHALAQGQAPAVQVAQTQNSQSSDPETDDDQGGAVRGSLQLSGEAQGTELPDAQQQAQYRAPAKITPGQVQQAALAAMSSAVTSVQLEEEHGSLMYSVVIGSTEAKVDAGTGRVLQQETAEQGRDETGENDSN